MDILNTPLHKLIETNGQVQGFVKKQFGSIKIQNYSINEVIEQYFTAGYAKGNESRDQLRNSFLEFCKNSISPDENEDSDLHLLTIIDGEDKNHRIHTTNIDISMGTVVAIVGPTSSGKSELLDDIEGLVKGDSKSHRKILLDHIFASDNVSAESMIKRVSLSYSKCTEGATNVREFIYKHLPKHIQNPLAILVEILHVANQLIEESVTKHLPIEAITERQMKALLIAKVALTSNAPILLLDELESFGINTYKAFKVLHNKKRICILATHDPLLILMSDKRIVMKDGAMSHCIRTTDKEKALMQELIKTEKRNSAYRESFRKGEVILL